MASEQQVKEYLAYWFQLGRRVFGPQDIALRPSPVIIQNRYSSGFEACWQQIMDHAGANFYLEGTTQTLAELLTPAWEVERCSRCPMLVPMRVGGLPTGWCPCSEIAGWPNLDVPQPRLPVDSQHHLEHICARIQEQPDDTGALVQSRYPLPPSIALRTAIDLHLAKLRGEPLPPSVPAETSPSPLVTTHQPEGTATEAALKGSGG